MKPEIYFDRFFWELGTEKLSRAIHSLRRYNAHVADKPFEREAIMPVYDYVCNDCHKPFELVLTLKEHETAIKCPKCGSRNVEQEATAFFAVTGRKS